MYRDVDTETVFEWENKKEKNVPGAVRQGRVMHITRLKRDEK
jgi:hypothetical protein